MGDLGKIIPLTKEEIEIYINYDFGFFLEKAFDNFNVNAEDRQISKRKYQESKRHLELSIKNRKKQTLLLVEGNIRKMHSGGLLPGLFNLSEARKVNIFRYDDAGENHANFEIWRKYKRREIFLEKFWAIVLKVGAGLAILLALFQVISVIHRHFQFNL